MTQGPIPTLSGGLNAARQTRPIVVGTENEQLINQLHGSKYAASINGRLFAAAVTGVTTSVALATTYTGLCLSNPAASGKNLSVRRVSGGLLVAPSTITSIGLIVGYLAAGITVHTTPVTYGPISQLLNEVAASVAKADAACTLVGTPRWARWLAQAPDATHSPAFDVDLEGGFTIPPGGYVAIGTNIAGPASGLNAAIEWEEIAIPS